MLVQNSSKLATVEKCMALFSQIFLGYFLSWANPLELIYSIVFLSA